MTLGAVNSFKRSFLSFTAELLDSNTVHVHDALLGEGFSHGDAVTFLGLVLGLTNETGLSELVEAVADVLSGGHFGGFFLGTTAGLATEVLAESLNTGLLSHVELVADSSGANVKPVSGEGVKLLVAGGLNCNGPLLNIIFIRT